MEKFYTPFANVGVKKNHLFQSNSLDMHSFSINVFIIFKFSNFILQLPIEMMILMLSSFNLSIVIFGAILVFIFCLVFNICLTFIMLVSSLL